jgi:fatty acid desaturase
MSGWQNEPTDLRGDRRRSERALVIAVIVALLVVGSLVIGLVYGWQAVFTGLICLLPGAGALMLLWLLLRFIERWLERDE